MVDRQRHNGGRIEVHDQWAKKKAQETMRVLCKSEIMKEFCLLCDPRKNKEEKIEENGDRDGEETRWRSLTLRWKGVRKLGIALFFVLV